MVWAGRTWPIVFICGQRGPAAAARSPTHHPRERTANGLLRLFASLNDPARAKEFNAYTACSTLNANNNMRSNQPVWFTTITRYSCDRNCVIDVGLGVTTCLFWTDNWQASTLLSDGNECRWTCYIAGCSGAGRGAVRSCRRMDSARYLTAGLV